MSVPLGTMSQSTKKGQSIMGRASERKEEKQLKLRQGNQPASSGIGSGGGRF